MKNQIKSSLLFLSFLFLSQLNAITPENFDSSIYQWSLKNGFIDGYQLYYRKSQKPTETIEPIDALTKSVVDLFKNHNFIFSNFDKSKLEKLFLFIDTVISKLIQNHSTGLLILLENTYAYDVFTYSDISNLITILFSDITEKNISALAEIFCERINSLFMISFTDEEAERRVFLANMIEVVREDQRAILINNLPLNLEAKNKVFLQLELNKLDRLKRALIDKLTCN